jgi:hypothetical protein
VDRSGLLPAQVEALEQPAPAGLAVADPEAALDQGAQVAGAPEPGALEDQGLERGLLALVERAGPAGAMPVAQALKALGVVAVHPVTEGPPGHPGEPGRLLPRQAVERVGERKQAGADPAVPLAAGETAQLGRVVIAADRQRSRHGGIAEKERCHRNASSAPSSRHQFMRSV